MRLVKLAPRWLTCAILLAGGCDWLLVSKSQSVDGRLSPGTWNLSDFDVSLLETQTRFDLLPQDWVYSAFIQQEDEGGYWLEMTVVVGFSRDGGLLIEELPGRYLTAAEVDRIRQAFAAVTFEPPTKIEVEPVYYYELRWDDTVVTDLPGPKVWVSEASMQQILALLEELRDGP